MENVKPVDQSVITNNSEAGNLTAPNTLNPITDVNALDNQGNNLSSHGRFDLAITFYDKALALDPSNLKVLIHKADSLSKLSRYEDAVKTYDKALAIQPTNLTVLFSKADILPYLGRYDDAISIYDTI